MKRVVNPARHSRLPRMRSPRTLRSLLVDNATSQVMDLLNIGVAANWTVRNPGIGPEVNLEADHCMGLVVPLLVAEIILMTSHEVMTGVKTTIGTMYLTGIHIVVIIVMDIDTVMIMTDTIVMVMTSTVMTIMTSIMMTIMTSTVISILIEVMTGIMMRKISIGPHSGVPIEVGLQIILASKSSLMTVAGDHQRTPPNDGCGHSSDSNDWSCSCDLRDRHQWSDSGSRNRLSHSDSYDRCRSPPHGSWNSHDCMSPSHNRSPPHDGRSNRSPPHDSYHRRDSPHCDRHSQSPNRPCEDSRTSYQRCSQSPVRPKCSSS